MTDFEKFARVAHKVGVPLIIDNTFATPVNCRPFEWGADIVTHSTTKYMDGHGAAVGGCIVDSGKFDWMAHADKFPGLCTPDDSYHGVTYTERFGLDDIQTTAIVQMQLGKLAGLEKQLEEEKKAKKNTNVEQPQVMAEETTADERQNAFTAMMKIALELAE